MREKIKDVFKALRKKQIIARMDHLCCSSCAGYSLATKLDEMPEAKAKKKIGFAYWHGQDEESYQKYGTLTIRYGGIDTRRYPDRDKETGIDSKKIGEMIVAEFLAAGVPVKWNGDPNKCIFVGDSQELVDKESF